MSPCLAWAVVAGVLAGLAAALCWPVPPREPDRAAPRTGRLVAGAATALAALPLLVGVPTSWAGPAAVAALLGTGAAALARRRAHRAGCERTRAQALAFCDELTAGLAAGLPPQTALEASTGAWPVLAEASVAGRLGGSVPAALRTLAERPGAGDLRQVAAAWQVAHRSGASLATALAGVVGALREQQRTRRLVASELASARATARLMAGLPVVTLLLGSGTGGSPLGFLLGTTGGQLCLAAGVGLALLGLWWIEAIADAVEREVG